MSRADQRLERYAALTLEIGLQLRAGQDLAIDAMIEHAPLARALAEQAYRRGAHYVDIWYWDPHAKRSRVRHAPKDTLPWTPDWMDRRYQDLAERGGALVNLRGDPEPNLLAGLDGRRAGLDRLPAHAARYRLQSQMLVPWAIVYYPTEAWAQTMFGSPDVERLWTHLERFLRLDQPDPIAAWRQHLARLRARAVQLTELELDALHFQGPGTDLTIGLIPQARWDISQALTSTGQTALLNLPTEEVYTTPDRRRIDGVIRSTRPLALAGSVIEDLELAFAGGRVQTVRATTGADVVRTQQATDTGASMLGEVALVDGTSPIGQSGLTFLDTGLDENATCHLAWGFGIPTVIPGWSERTPEELLDLGVNQSVVHTDFMVGGPDVTVTGHRRDGSHATILQADTWQLAT